MVLNLCMYYLDFCDCFSLDKIWSVRKLVTPAIPDNGKSLHHTRQNVSFYVIKTTARTCAETAKRTVDKTVVYVHQW